MVSSGLGKTAGTPAEMLEIATNKRLSSNIPGNSFLQTRIDPFLVCIVFSLCLHRLFTSPFRLVNSFRQATCLVTIPHWIHEEAAELASLSGLLEGRQDDTTNRQSAVDDRLSAFALSTVPGASRCEP
jgi:hypothetical protein